MERLGREEVLGRELFVLDLARLEDLPDRLVLPTKHFACLVAWDSSRASIEQLSRLAECLLASGAVYVCAWGPGCERVHDIVDEVAIGPHPAPEEAGTVTTTWHSDDTLEDTIWFALMNSWPDEPFEATCGSTLGLAIGAPEWAATIRHEFSQPGEFVERNS